MNLQDDKIQNKLDEITGIVFSCPDKGYRKILVEEYVDYLTKFIIAESDYPDTNENYNKIKKLLIDYYDEIMIEVVQHKQKEHPDKISLNEFAFKKNFLGVEEEEIYETSDTAGAGSMLNLFNWNMYQKKIYINKYNEVLYSPLHKFGTELTDDEMKELRNMGIMFIQMQNENLSEDFETNKKNLYQMIDDLDELNAEYEEELDDALMKLFHEAGWKSK